MEGLYSILKEIRPTHATVNLAAIQNNLRYIRSLAGNKMIMPIVKANAYGHGILEVTRECVAAGAEYIGVGFLEEGIFLRQNDVDAPILVMGGILGYQVKKFIQYDLEMTVSSLELAAHIDSQIKKQKAKVHLKIDTGMERIGVSYKYAVEFVRRVAMMKNIEIVGLYSHFSASDEEDHSFTHQQFERFQDIIGQLKKLGIEIPLKHIANSASLINYPETHMDLVRPGLLVYGISPSPHKQDAVPVIPVLTLSSKVVFIKRVPAGTGISYNRKYFTDRDCNIVTVPIGYGDGYSRILTNKGEVLIHGKRYPIVGAVCMDQMMVNLGDDNAAFGDEVVLIGRMGNETITAWDVAGKMGTIPYEITCMINARVPRIFVRN